MTEEILALLHDHYKESFNLIRQQEQRRDRLFILLTVLFGALILQTQYPTALRTAGLTIAGVQVSISDLPLPMLLDLTWALSFLVSLKYCQMATHAERQYQYLHRLEAAISSKLGDSELYCREGKEYLQRYPLLLNWAWLCYVILFPLIVISGTIVLFVTMWVRLRYPIGHKVFVSVCATALVTSFILYRFGASTVEMWHKRQRGDDTKAVQEAAI